MNTRLYFTLVLSLCCLLTSCTEDTQKPVAEQLSANVTPPAVETSAPSKEDTTAVKEPAVASPKTGNIEVSSDQLPEKPVKDIQKPSTASKESPVKTEGKGKKKRRGKPVISFKETLHNYGRIKQGEKVEHKFTFVNTGQGELVITNATATCGCTQPSFPFMPIMPGEEGYIGVVFDSKGKLGRQKPTITITTNATPATYNLYLEGHVDATEDTEENKEKTPENQ